MDPKNHETVLETAYAMPFHSMVQTFTAFTAVIMRTKPDVRCRSEQGWPLSPCKKYCKARGRSTRLGLGPQKRGLDSCARPTFTPEVPGLDAGLRQYLEGYSFLRSVFWPGSRRGQPARPIDTGILRPLYPWSEVERVYEFGKFFGRTHFCHTPGTVPPQKWPSPIPNLSWFAQKKTEVNLLVKLRKMIRKWPTYQVHIKLMPTLIINGKTIAQKAQSIGRKRIQTFPVAKTTKLDSLWREDESDVY